MRCAIDVRRHRGLTLLEVVVAMTVLAIGIAGAMGAISACVRSSDAAARYSRGALLAQQVAAEFERSETLDSGNLSGTFDSVDADYAWSADIGTADEQGLQPVQITVSWQGGKRQFLLSTIVRPHALPAAPEAPSTPTTPSTPATPTGGAS